ncbi:MAG: hypothetical protein ACOH14_06305 [Rhodoglobus sp.]
MSSLLAKSYDPSFVESSSDRDFADFLRHVPLSVTWRERDRAVSVQAAVQYQRVSDALVEAMRVGSPVLMTLALEGAI